MKKRFIRKLIFLFLFSLSAIPGLTQTTLTLTSCDTTLIDPSPAFLGACVITVKSANNTRLSYNVDFFDVNYSDVAIYDGPNIAAPRITLLGDPFTILNQQFGGQSSGSTLTFQFGGIYPYGPNHFKIHIRCVQTPQNYPVLQPLPALGASGNIQAADYDNDGDKDFVIGGRIFRNDSYFDSLYLFERKAGIVSGAWYNVSATSADFDGDGLKDIFLTGSSTAFGGLLRPVAAIYKNNGNNSFTLATPEAMFAGANRGGCSVVDFNNDGKPDICYTGSTHYYQNNSRIFKLYINNGNMNFTDAGSTLPGISGLINAHMSWADSDGDGDQDLLINGHDGNASTARLYTVNGSVFTDQNLALQPTSDGLIKWADMNMDGKPDIINSGVTTPDNVNAIVPQFFINNGGNSFTAVPTNLPRLALGSFDCADYDNDHDLDIVMDGADFVNNTGKYAYVYKNNGNGQFQQINLDGATGSTTIRWFDFNNDGRADVVGAGGYYIKNMGNDSFHIASFTTTSRDFHDDGMLIDDFNSDGLIDIFCITSLTDVDCNASSNTTLVTGRAWRLSGVPKLKEVMDLNSINPFPPVSDKSYYWKWGDFDSDGKPDVILTNEVNASSSLRGGEDMVVFGNKGNDTFAVIFDAATTPLPNFPLYGVTYIQPGLADLDNDGINELVFPSNNTVYKRNGNQWELFYTDQQGGNPGSAPSYIAFADYNQDGFMDAALGGYDIVHLMKNNGHGRLVSDSYISSIGIQFYNNTYRQIHWVDMDNDGDPDLLVAKGIFENRKDSFVYVSSQFLQCHSGVGDLNGDGFKDIVAVRNVNSFEPMDLYYNEQGSGFFDHQSMGTLAYLGADSWNHSAVCADIDNDGDEDILDSGGGGCTIGAFIIVNEGRFTDKLLHVVYPNGGELFNLGASKTIKWYGYQVSSTVKIEISRDSGASWQLIAASVASTTGGGSYSWTVTGPVSDKCIIRITDNTNNVLSDKSDAVFKITDPLALRAYAGNDTTVCQLRPVRLGRPALAGVTYSWSSAPSGFTSAEANPLVTPAQTTTYFLAADNGVITARDTVTVHVVLVPVALDDTLSACPGISYNIGIPAVAGYTYLWRSIPAGFVSTLSNPIITARGNNMYYLTMTDSNTGCSGTDSIYVTTDYCKNRASEITVHPNPTEGLLWLDGMRLSRHWETLEIYDVLGRKRRPDIDLRGLASLKLSIADLNPGIYFIRIINFDGGMLVFRVVKK
ncbi:MAG: T9SS type A sorting domain-containing protein [Ferruginibacter sp.]